MKLLYFSILFVFFFPTSYNAQVSYGAASAFGLRKIMPTYNGNAIRVRRACDNASRDIGFTSCGDLDTVALKTFVVAYNPLSAISVTSAAAYSLRKLRCTYAGNAIRVRSSGVGTPTLDIGFTTEGDLDTAALKTFIGTNSGFVTTWYDQSGNARNATQATNGNQPRIVNAGVIERQGGMPAVRFLGSNYSMSTAAFTTYNTAACFNAVSRVSVNHTYNTMVNKTTNNFPAPLDFYNAQMVIGDGTNYNFFTYSQTFNAALPLSIWTYQGAASGNYNFYYNGSASGSGAVGFFGDNGNPLVLGSRADGVTGLNGWLSEVITFNVLPSATDRQFIEWSQSQYYSISGPVLTTLPGGASSGSVTAWYNQAGTGNAVQATIGSQPRIVNVGVIEKNTSIPAIYFAGAPQNLVAPLSTTAYPLSISVLANTSGSSTAGAFVKLGTDVNAGQAGVAIGIGNSGGTFDAAGTSVIGLKEWIASCPSNPNVNYPSNFFTSTTVQQSGGTMNTYLNGTNVPLSNSTATVGASITGSLLIGGYTNGTNRYPMVKESEVTVFASALSNTRRILLETNQAAYNTITITNNKYTPPTATTYQRFVNGVGRESATDSVAGTRSTVGMGFIIGQTAADFLKNNGDYLTIGINCPMGSSVTTANVPATVVARWLNDWYLNKTDVSSNNGTMTIFFDFGDYGVTGSPGSAPNYEMLYRSTSTGNFTIVPGVTKSVVGDRVMFSVDASNITTNFYYTLGSRNLASSPLPIELTSFEAACEDGKVNVWWSTSSQDNNAYFMLDRGADGINYKTIGKIEGAGTNREKTNYVFTDQQPLSGISYYRLNQTDLNGQSKFYNVVSAECGLSTKNMRVYPNPANDKVVLAFNDQLTNATVRLINISGQVVLSKTSVSGNLLSIDISQQVNGIYIIEVDSGTSVLRSKLIKD